MEDEGITENPHTSLTIESIRSQWNALAILAKEKAQALDKEILASSASSLSPEQVKEFRDCFIHFDKDKDSALNRLELGSCLQSLGYAYTMEEGGALDQLLKTIDTNQDGKVEFEEFIKYMEKINTDSDTPDQINSAFSTIAGGRDYITEAELRNVLPPQKVDYLIKTMPPYPGQAKAYDYKKFTDGVYRH